MGADGRRCLWTTYGGYYNALAWSLTRMSIEEVVGCSTPGGDRWREAVRRERWYRDVRGTAGMLQT